MADITRRRTGEFLRKLFEIVMPHPEGLPGREALAKLRDQVKLTEYEAGHYESGKQRFEHIVRFALDDEASKRLPLWPIHFLAPAT